MEYLGFQVTRDDVKPTEKYTSNKNIKLTTSQKEVRQFIGVVNNYLNMWVRHSHKLWPSTKIMPSKVKFIWTKIKQEAFGEINQIVAHNTLLAYP